MRTVYGEGDFLLLGTLIFLGLLGGGRSCFLTPLRKVQIDDQVGERFLFTEVVRRS